MADSPNSFAPPAHDDEIGEAEALRALAAHLRASRLDAFAALLGRLHFPGCALSAKLDPELQESFLIRFGKTGESRAELAFSPRLAALSDLETTLLTFSWILPLLSAFTRSSQGVAGSALLNHWDAGVEPGLSYCAAGDGFFLIPDNLFVSNRGYRAYLDALGDGAPWDARRPLAFWRGSTTGHARDWRELPRIRLCRLSQAHPELCDAGVTSVVQLIDDDKRAVEESGLKKPPVPAIEQHRYKYLIDIDGNGNAWAGLFEKLATGSAVLKVASPYGFRQWYYDRLRPWTHYVPVSADLEDLMDKIAWLMSHDDEARRIGDNGRAFARSLDYDSEVALAIQTINAAFRVASHGEAGDDAPAGCLRTHQNTIVAFHMRERRLVHVSGGQIRAGAELRPLTVEGEDSGVRLTAPGGACVARLTAEGEAALVDPDSGAEIALFARVPSGAGFALRREGKFLCAGTGGRVSLDRETAGLWETFTVAPP